MYRLVSPIGSSWTSQWLSYRARRELAMIIRTDKMRGQLEEEGSSGRAVDVPV